MAKEKIAGKQVSRLAGKYVAVIGLGREGIDLVRFLRSQKAEVTVLDAAIPSQLKDYREAKRLGAKFQLGKDYLNNLTDFQIIFRSPGVPLDLPQLKTARKAKVKISSAIKFFFELCPAKIIGVTGTKGKSTTVSLIYHLLSALKKRVWLAGNIGQPPLQLLGKLKSSHIVILELSSFQLEDMIKSPNVAVLLNVVSEHLDRHKTFAKYVTAKSNIYLHQAKSDWLITSQDFPATRAAAKKPKAKLFPYSVRKVLRRGLYVARDEVIYRQIKNGKRQVIAGLDKINLRGEHNLQNVLPAVATAIINRVPVAKIVKRLKTFKSLPHRLEVVKEKGEVIFVNDSLGTTPEAAAAAVQAFAYRDVALILGGVYKGGDIKQLAKTVAKSSAVFVALIGKSADKFRRALRQFAPVVQTGKYKTFKQAIDASYKQVKRKGGAVVLSPACASFDMFKDAYHRGEEFRRIVKKL